MTLKLNYIPEDASVRQTRQQQQQQQRQKQIIPLPVPRLLGSFLGSRLRGRLVTSVLYPLLCNQANYFVCCCGWKKIRKNIPLNMAFISDILVAGYVYLIKHFPLLL